MPKFSIVIPVYNTGKYLYKCVQSVQVQRIRDWEIILIDDGSFDNSADICAQIANEDVRIKFHRQENCGQLATRQQGIQYASGEYMLFLDSDDFWEPDLLEKMEALINEFHSDIIMFRLKVIKNGECLFHSKKVYEDKTVFSDDKGRLIHEILTTNNLNSVSLKAVRRTLALECVENNNDSFSIRQSEDLLQVIKWFEKAKTVVYTDAVLYNYILRNDSVSRTFRPKKYLDVFYVRQALKNFALRMGADGAELKLLEQGVCIQVIRMIEEMYVYCESKADVRPVIKDIYEHPFMQSLMLHCAPGGMQCSFDFKVSFFLFRKHWFKLLELWIGIVVNLKSIKGRLRKGPSN